MKTKRGGWMMLETITAIVLLMLLGGVLYAALRAQERGMAVLSDSRAALRTAEAALTTLQTGGQAANGVTVERLAPSSDVAGMQWVRVTAQVAGHSAELVGLVPAQTVAMGQGGLP